MKTSKVIKIFSILLALAMLITVVPMDIFASETIESEFAGGSGTVVDPFLIETKHHLSNVRNHLNAHYKMIADIEFTDEDFAEGGEFYNDGKGWMPIGTDRLSKFTGSLNGDGYNINNLRIQYNGSDIIYIGLFGYFDGSITGINMRNCNINASSESATLYVGGLAGYSYLHGIISNCSTDGVISSRNYAGGIVGYNYGTIENCYNSSSIAADWDVGGITGCNYGSVSNCYNCGIIEGDPNYAGGIAGDNSETVTLCYNVGSIKGGTYRGGICGRNKDIMTSCYYYDEISIGTGYGADTSTKCTMEELQIKSTYSGFDFENIWEIQNTIMYPFPTLRDLPHNIPQINTTEFAGGTGDVWNPYIIENAVQLNNIRYHLDAHYKVTADIEFAEVDFSKDGLFYNAAQGWIPIGNKATPFRGSFDGGGHTVSGLIINATINNTVYVGLFGYSDVTIKNIEMTRSNITIVSETAASASSIEYAYVGCVVGYGSASNCTVSGNLNVLCRVSARDVRIYAGGVVGQGSAADCNNTCELKADVSSGSNSYATVYLGGVCGRGFSVTNCSNSGTVSGDSKRNNSSLTFGGIAGIATTVVSCYNNANITANGNTINDVCIGGICGIGTDGMSINQSYNTGAIKGSSEVESGGIVGRIGGRGSITDAYNIGAVSGGYCGGILGVVSTNSVSISNCYNLGIIEKGYYKYAIIGCANHAYTISNCYSLEGIAQTRSSTISCSEIDMVLRETYSGFDFNVVWQIGANPDYPWPELRALSPYRIIVTGDINSDGTINAVDSNLLKRIIAGTLDMEDEETVAKAADINGDGTVNAVDSNLLKRVIAGTYIITS